MWLRNHKCVCNVMSWPLSSRWTSMQMDGELFPLLTLELKQSVIQVNIKPTPSEVFIRSTFTFSLKAAKLALLNNFSQALTDLILIICLSPEKRYALKLPPPWSTINVSGSATLLKFLICSRISERVCALFFAEAPAPIFLPAVTKKNSLAQALCESDAVLCQLCATTTAWDCRFFFLEKVCVKHTQGVRFVGRQFHMAPITARQLQSCKIPRVQYY